MLRGAKQREERDKLEGVEYTNCDFVQEVRDSWVDALVVKQERLSLGQRLINTQPGSFFMYRFMKGNTKLHRWQVYSPKKQK